MEKSGCTTNSIDKFPKNIITIYLFMIVAYVPVVSIAHEATQIHMELPKGTSKPTVFWLFVRSLSLLLGI